MSLFRRSSPSAFRATPAPAASADPPVREVTLLIETPEGREALLARAADALPAGEVLVQVKDLVGERRSFRTVPDSERAVLVAREAPVILRGGLTSLVSYYRVPADDARAREEHFENGEFSHAYDVDLSVVSRGRASATPRSIPA